MDNDFQTFWDAWPKRIAKADARKAWEQTKDVRPDIAILLLAIKAQCKIEGWLKDGGKYIPYPATWLRGERWDDELVVEMPKDIVNEKLWHETATGIEIKGREHGLDPSQFESFPLFKAAVMRASMKAA
jgi:hypothetical protein